MKIIIAIVVSAVTTSLVGVAMAEVLSVYYRSFLSETGYGLVISLGCVAAPASVLHLFLRERKKEPYLAYALVGAIGVALFFLIRPYVMHYSMPIERARPAFIALTFAGFVGGLIYRASLAFCDRQRKKAIQSRQPTGLLARG